MLEDIKNSPLYEEEEELARGNTATMYAAGTDTVSQNIIYAYSWAHRTKNSSYV